MLKETVYDKFLRLQDNVKKVFSDVDEQKFYKIISRLSTWHYPSKRWKGFTLSKDEVKIYEWLLNNKYNPDTVYKWYRVLGFNKSIQNDIKNKRITFEDAKTYLKPFRRLTSLESELMYQIKKDVEHYIVK